MTQKPDSAIWPGSSLLPEPPHNCLFMEVPVDLTSSILGQYVDMAETLAFLSELFSYLGNLYEKEMVQVQARQNPKSENVLSWLGPL